MGFEVEENDKRTLKEKVDSIPGGGDGWYKCGTGERYLRAAQALIDLGMSEDGAVDFVNDLYWWAAACFGG